MDIGSIVKRDKETLTKYLLSLELKLKKLYGDTYAKAMQLQSVREAIERGDMGFTWKGNPDAEKKLDKLLDNLANNSFTGIAEGINRSYNQGQTTAEKAVESQYKDSPNKEQINDICKEATEQHRINVTKSYTTATQANGGQKLSSRVWGLNEQSKTELEIAIQNAIIEGKSADEASRDIRKYLNNPDALFRRVRDKETGELVLSEAAKNYHPGQGVYRSAYKNAMRMARTEINAAYLQAEIESYQSNPLVTGYEIKLSGNHTTTLPNGKVVHLEDICDRLAGEYPKTFRFTGWHPQCRCYIVPITLKEQTADKQLEDKGEIDSSKEQIDEVPKNMTDWVQDNQERIDNAKQLPPFIEDNKQLIEPTKEPEPKKPTPQEIADKRHAERTAEQVADIKARWKEHEEQVRREQIKRIAEERHAKRTPEQVQAIKDAWDIHNSKLKTIINDLQTSRTKIDYNAVKPLKKPLTEQEIIDKVGGGDLTKGSCASAALSYIGNKHGLDVRDFRGGKSLNRFSVVSYDFIDSGIGIGQRTKNVISDTIRLINGNVVEGKEYFLSSGRHAAIIRKVGGKLEYLELQCDGVTDTNGWKRFDLEPRYILHERFGAPTYSRTTYMIKLIESSLLGNDPAFRIMLGYLNTDAGAQMKGIGGAAK